MRVFGTDGIRGVGSLDILEDPRRSFEKERLFSKQLCGEVAYCASLISEGGDILIGWDRRPFNEKIAKHAIERLMQTGRKISVLGETTTPALQFMMLENNATLGLMITASHNPSEDTGLKILFEGGRKPTREEELTIEKIMFKKTEKLSMMSDVKDILPAPYIDSVSEAIREMSSQGVFPNNKILIDGSGGWISTWLAGLISSFGVACTEVSDRRQPINSLCGAGDLSEGWISWQECSSSEHSLLRAISPSQRGTILGFCFDGDGDRCFLICSEGDGAQIIGGDGFLRLFFPKCDDAENFVVALTIESALDVSRSFKNLDNGRLIQTGVGDRWLQHALMGEKSDLKIGAEPSGHVILQQKCGLETGLWGDGVSTMLEFLRLIHRLGPNWVELVIENPSRTISESIYPSDRDSWDPNGRLGEMVVDVICLSFNIDMEELGRLEIKEEDSLLSLHHSNEEEWSISVRNSGTEPKTRVTIRTTDTTPGKGERLLAQLMASIKSELYIGTMS